MDTATAFVILTAWLVTGFSGFVFWWTRDHDYTRNEIPLSVGAACTGPFAWWIGYSIHG